MKLEFWSDIICPWCGLAEHRLARALRDLGNDARIDVIHRSFQTHPEIDRKGVSQRALLAQHGIDPSAAESILGPIEQAASQEGLTPYRAIDRMLGPTYHAHALLAFATDKGVTDAWGRMFRAHFGQGRELWTIDQVTDFAANLGLDRQAARVALENGTYRAKIYEDQMAARRAGATGVPFIVIDGRHVIAGARTGAELVDTLRRLLDGASTDKASDPGPLCSATGRA